MFKNNQILVKNLNFDLKIKFCLKIEILIKKNQFLVKNRNFDLKKSNFG